MPKVPFPTMRVEEMNYAGTMPRYCRTHNFPDRNTNPREITTTLARKLIRNWAGLQDRVRSIDKRPVDRPIKGIIFDFDGTLIGGIHLWIPALKHTLSHFGVEATSTELEEEFRKSYIDGTPGSPWRKIFRCRCPGKEDEAWSFLFETLKEAMNDVELSSKVRCFIQESRSKGTKVAIITFRSHDSAEQTLSKMNASHLFDVIVGSGDTSKEKPSPEPFLEISKRIGTKPSECLVIGDEPADIIGGNRAGMRTIGVLTGVSDRNMLRKAGAGMIVESLEDLPKALSEMEGSGIS